MEDLAPAPLRRGDPPLLVRAAAVIDAVSVCASPGAILLADGCIVAAGSPAAIGPVSAARTIDLPRHLVMPALVNAHCHLDLTDVGPLPGGGDFVAWIGAVRARRPTDEDRIGAAIRRGARLCQAGGTALVGDIAGSRSDVALRALRQSGLRGVSYREFFGLGSRAAAAITAIELASREPRDPTERVHLGLQPHAPYSCGPEVFAAAARCGLPLATHLAETPEEIEFVASAGGPLAEFIRGLGLWDAQIRGAGAHPIEALADALAAAPWTLAHVNYIEDRHIQMLARWPVSVVYCPRASTHFGHPRRGAAPHRYRDMVEAGINVALGTDSLACLDTPTRISPFDEMRLLWARDGADPRGLLRMATVAGALALGFDPSLVTLAPGATAGLIGLAVEGKQVETKDGHLAQALRGTGGPIWVAGGTCDG